MPKYTGGKYKGSQRKKQTSYIKNKKNESDLQYLEKVILGTGTEIYEQSDSQSNDKDINTKAVVKDKAPAWIDEDDNVQIEEGNRNNNDNKQHRNLREYKFHQVTGKPKWADSSKAADKPHDILTKCGQLIKKPVGLQPNLLRMKKLKDINCQSYAEGAVNIIEFHPTSTVALVAGLSGVASLYQVDGIENTKLQSVQFANFPINAASFIKHGEEFIAGSKRFSYFQCFNLMTGQIYKVYGSKLNKIQNIGHFSVSPDEKAIAVPGKEGEIHILCARTKELIANLHMNCNVNDVAFNFDGSKLYSHGSDGEVYVWDMMSRRCILKFPDDGCLQGTAIGVSPNDAYLACGSSSGVVNIYDIKDLSPDNAKPIKTFYNLVTSISKIKFNPLNEILAVSSYHKENSIRLIHVPSFTVFSNFPQQQIKSSHPNCFDFSPNSGFFGVGDNKRVAHLYRFDYYGNY